MILFIFTVLALLALAFAGLGLKLILSLFGVDVLLGTIFKWILWYVIPCGLTSLALGWLFFRKKKEIWSILFWVFALLETVFILIWFYKPSSPVNIEPGQVAGAKVWGSGTNLTAQADEQQARQFLAMLDETPMRRCTAKTVSPNGRFNGTELFFQNEQGELILGIRIFSKTGLAAVGKDGDYQYYCTRGDAQIDTQLVRDFVTEHGAKK